MSKKPYLYFDLVRTARILGKEALEEVKDELNDDSLTKVEILSD